MKGANCIGFTFGLLRFSALFILLSFLKEYLWLRTFETLFVSLKIIGIIMLVFGGLWVVPAIRSTDIRLFTSENGLSLFLIGLKTDQSLHVLLTMMFLRLIAGWVWALAIKIISPDIRPPQR